MRNNGNSGGLRTSQGCACVPIFTPRDSPQCRICPVASPAWTTAILQTQRPFRFQILFCRKLLPLQNYRRCCLGRIDSLICVQQKSTSETMLVIRKCLRYNFRFILSRCAYGGRMYYAWNICDFPDKACKLLTSLPSQIRNPSGITPLAWI